MGAPSKTPNQTLLPLQAVTHPVTIVGSELDISAIIRIGFTLSHGFVEAGANTNPGVFFAQVSNASADNVDWATLFPFPVNSGTPDSEVMTALEPIGEKVMAVNSTTGFVAEDDLFLFDIDTPANSEWNKCQEIVTNTSINLVDGLKTAKPVAGSGSIIYNDAFILPVSLDVTSWTRFRLLYMHEGITGANGYIKSLLTSWDSFE